MARRRNLTPNEFIGMVRDDATLSERVFQYYYNDGRFGNLDEMAARIEWNRNLTGNTAEFRTFVISYMPVYTQNAPPQRQTFNIGSFTLDERLRAPLAVGGITAVTGLAAMVIGGGVDNEYIMNAGKAGLYFSPAVGWGTYHYAQLNDTGKLWLKRAGVAGYLSMMAVFSRGGIDNETAGSLLNLAGWAGLVASATAAFAAVVLRRN